VLLLVSSPKGPATANLIGVTNAIKKGGLFIVASILVGKWKEKLFEHTHLHKLWSDLVTTAQWKAFVDLIVAPSVRIGVQSLILTGGVGGMRPNTVVLGQISSTTAKADPQSFATGVEAQVNKFPETAGQLSPVDYVSIIKDIVRTGKNTLVASNFEKLSMRRIRSFAGVSKPQQWLGIKPVQAMTIDAWIVEDIANSASASVKTNLKTDITDDSLYSDTSTLIIMLAYILSTVHDWKPFTRIRVISVVRGDHQKVFERDKLRIFLHKCRIQADIEVLAIPVGGEIADEIGVLNATVSQNSSTTAISFFPLMPLPQHKKQHAQYAQMITKFASGLGPLYMVRANEKVFAFEI